MSEANGIWIVLKPFPVKRNGKMVRLARGDEVPEAEGWANRDYWEARRFIRKLARPLSKEAEAFALKDVQVTKADLDKKGKSKAKAADKNEATSE